jgi:hypothetical protein
MRSKIISGVSNPISASAINYAPLIKCSTAWNAAETNQFQVIPISGVLQNLRVVLSAAPGASASRTFTIRKNGVDTGLTLTFSGSQTSATIRNPVPVVAGDLVSISATPTNSPVQAAVTWSIDFKGSTPNQSVLIGNSSIVSASIAYCPVQGQLLAGTSSPANETLISTNGVISNLVVTLASGATASRTFTLRKNGVDTGLAVTFGIGDTTASNNVNTVSVVPGDRIVLALSGTLQTHAGIFTGLAFTATTDGEGVLSCGSANSPSTTVTNYATVGGVAGNSWDATEANVQQVTNDVLIRRFDVRLTTAPGAGNSWTFNVRLNGAPCGLQVVISGTNTTGSAVLDVAVAAGSLLAIEAVPAAGPTGAGRTEWSLTTFQLNDGGRNQAVLFH